MELRMFDGLRGREVKRFMFGIWLGTEEDEREAREEDDGEQEDQTLGAHRAI
jgi:hypothetical protein